MLVTNTISPLDAMICRVRWCQAQNVVWVAWIALPVNNEQFTTLLFLISLHQHRHAVVILMKKKYDKYVRKGERNLLLSFIPSNTAMHQHNKKI